MASYYYLVSSLPTLKAEGEQPLNYEDFLRMCKTVVNKSTYEKLENLSYTDCKGPLLSEWSTFYRALNDELNYQRNVKLGRNATAPSYKDPEASAAITQAIAAPNPLISEQILLNLEFKRLDSLVGLHNFDDYVLFGYAIKLRLLERQKTFIFEEGKQEFTSLFENIQQQILNV